MVERGVVEGDEVEIDIAKAYFLYSNCRMPVRLETIVKGILLFGHVLRNLFCEAG
jgi:hypothetical protein